MFFYYYRLFYEIKCKYTKNIVDRQYVFTMKNINNFCLIKKYKIFSFCQKLSK